ncbi:MAG: SAM-dependent methyltransferase [Hyphomicrobiales bacterium]|nr:SAM-dependent methyltransferase [Hyphomicrobiales bacterium]
MTPLDAKIRARIEAEGPICVSDYMAMALQDDEHGYYRRREAIGRGGDFITAPEISQIFGELIGLWAAHVWRGMGSPAPFNLIELGPGRGVLMADALRAARTAPGFVEAARVTLVERSSAMRAHQRQALGGHDPEWLDDLAAAPVRPSIVIANEFFDALPIRQFVFEGGGWRRRRVGVDVAEFNFVTGEPAAPENTPAAACDGAVFEDSPAREAVVGQFARLAAQPFAALVVDYGHNGDAFGDTLQAVAAHKFAGVFDTPGEADLSAHVNFAALAHTAAARGLKTFGPMPMGLFLLKLGAGERLRALVRAAPGHAESLTAGVRRLTSPQEMGELFRALAIVNGPTPPPFA